MNLVEAIRSRTGYLDIDGPLNKKAQSELVAELARVLQNLSVAYLRDPDSHLNDRVLKALPQAIQDRTIDDIEGQIDAAQIEREDAPQRQADSLTRTIDSLNRLKNSVEARYRVKVTPVKGRTGKGYRLTVNASYDLLARQAG